MRWVITGMSRLKKNFSKNAIDWREAVELMSIFYMKVLKCTVMKSRLLASMSQISVVQNVKE